MAQQSYQQSGREVPQGPQLPQRLPLVVVPSNRDSTVSKDARLVNCYVEKTETGEYWVYKRPGLLTSVTKSGNGYGVYNWLGSTYAIFDTTIYKNGVSIGTVDSTGGVYRFSQTSGATPRLVFGNGVKAYTWDNATLAQIVDADFPTSFVKGWSYLDRTTYVMKSNAAIQGSDLDDPTSWDPLNILTAQIEPDLGIALAKQLVYTVAMKQWSTEAFYDAANTSGSPLATVQGAKLNYGSISAESVQDIDGTLIWATTSRSSSVQVLMVEGMKPKPVSTQAIDRLLDMADFSACFSWQLKLSGHRFYVLTLKNNNLTLAYDLTEGMWHQWTDANGNYFPIVSATYGTGQTHILQHETNGKLYLADPSYLTDDSSLITVDIYTPNYDAGTRRRKMMKFMEFLADQQAGSVLQCRHNDSDFDPTKWSNFRNVNLAQKRAFLTDCGTFSRRAYNFRHSCNTSLRIQAVELQLDLGTL